LKTEFEIGESKGTEVNERKDDGQVINAYNTICNVTEAGNVPVRMGTVPIWLYHKGSPEHKIRVYALLDNASGGTFIKSQYPYTTMDQTTAQVEKSISLIFCP